MRRSKIIYTSKENIYGLMPKVRELIHYEGILKVRDSGKLPVTIDMTFIPPYPFAGEPPDKRTIKAKNITDAYAKLVRFLRSYGYRLHA